MQITFLTRKSALIYRRGLRQRVASLTLNCNGDFAIRAYSIDSCNVAKKNTDGKLPNQGNVSDRDAALVAPVCSIVWIFHR